MIKRTLLAACLLLVLHVPRPALAQTPSPEALAAARALVAASHAAENVKLILPAIVQGRPQVEKDFDAILPVMLESFRAKIGDMIEQITIIYANNFTAAEMNELVAFYNSPTGQKFVSKAPAVAQQSMAVGQQFGAQVGRELQSKIIEELKKRGHNI